MESNFDKQSESTVDTLQTSYDYESVMHYDSYAFSTNGLQTIIPTKNSSAFIGQRIGMSPIDILEVQRYYNCVPTSNSINSCIVILLIFFIVQN